LDLEFIPILSILRLSLFSNLAHILLEIVFSKIGFYGLTGIFISEEHVSYHKRWIYKEPIPKVILC